MKIIPIHEADDPRLDVYLRLSDHQLRNRLDPTKAVIIAESRLVIEDALARGHEPLSLFLDERHLDAMSDLLGRLADTVPVYVAPRALMSQVVGFSVTRGYFCALRRPRERSVEEALEGASRVAVLEGIVDVTNVGALYRCAAALGTDAVLLSPSCADPLSRRALRVSMGSALKLRWARVAADRWPQAAVDALHDHGFTCVALTLADDAVPLDDPRLKGLDRVALFLGTEGSGLSQACVDACDQSVVIPMANGVDSLNVATAAAIAFWELRRR